MDQQIGWRTTPGRVWIVWVTVERGAFPHRRQLEQATLQAEREKKDRTKLRLAKLFFDRNVLGKEPKDIAYYDDLVSRLCG